MGRTGVALPGGRVVAGASEPVLEGLECILLLLGEVADVTCEGRVGIDGLEPLRVDTTGARSALDAEGASSCGE